MYSKIGPIVDHYRCLEIRSSDISIDKPREMPPKTFPYLFVVGTLITVAAVVYNPEVLLLIVIGVGLKMLECMTNR